MNSIKLKFVIFLLSISLIEWSMAQKPKLEFSTFTPFEKITNSKTTSIIQDSVGYIWIGTTEGLYRYDGQSINAYRYVENDPHSIPSNIVNQQFVDSKNRLWICTNEGLCIYNPELDNFTPIVLTTDLKGVTTAYITAIGEDKNGQIFVACDRILYTYDQPKKIFNKVTELKWGRINVLVFDELNNIWIGASLKGGLNYYNRQTGQMTSFENTPENKQSISSLEINDIALVKDMLWIGTDGGGIDSYNIPSKTFKQYLFPENLMNFAINILQDKKQNIWICTYGGLMLYNPVLDNFYRYYYEPNNPESIGGSIWDFYEDKQGNYWSVYTEGGIKMVKHKNKFSHIDSHPDKFWHLSNKNTTSVSVDATGNLWAGYYLSGIDVFNWKEKKTDRYTHKENEPTSLGNGTSFSIFRDSKQQMWVGSYLGGLQRFNPATKNFDSFINNPNDTLTIAINDVRSISEDKNGDLWIAVQGKGVDRFDPKTKTFQHFNAKNNQLSNDYTFQVLNDSKGNLWVATSWGLSMLENGKKIFRKFLYSKIDTTSINNNEIYSICEDQQQNIWVGTAEGLNKFDFTTQSFTRYSVGLKNNHIGAILCDQKGNIWVSTNVGISKFDQKTHHFTNYDQTDGLLSRDFSDRSCFKDSQNNLYFGGSEGVDYFNPDSLQYEKKQPTVQLTDFRIFNKSITWKNDSNIIQKNISYAKKITLGYQENSFTFVYKSINPPNPDAITYAYRLEGFDKEWIDAEAKNEVSYTNLNPGNYTFRVKAKYDNDNWNEKETSIDLEIVPAWWMTLWFEILMVFVVLTLVFGAVYLRIKQLRNQSKKLEALVMERTNEIQSKNDQLKDLNSNKDKLFSIISHDLRSPFSAILGFQDLLFKNYQDFSDAERQEMIGQVYRTTNLVYDLVENLLSWSRMQSNNIQYHPVSFELKEIILDKIELYQNIASAKKIVLSHQLPDQLNAFADINLSGVSNRYP